jgi:hypothetical protein
MKLFEDKTHDNYRRAMFGEDVYNYFDTNAQTKIAEIRKLLNRWFESYPEEYKIDLQHSFKNRFYDAFYELFIHETFYRQGYKLEPHPPIENSEKRPDFIARKGEEEFYIEATTVSFLSSLEKRKENFREKFIEELNKMNSANFWLGLKSLEFKKSNVPKVGPLRKKIESQLCQINSTDIKFHERKTLLNQELKFEDDNLRIILKVFIKSESANTEKDFRPIGVQFFPVTIKDATEDSDKILKSFKKKSKRYGHLNKPYIICLNLDFKFNLKYDADWAFYNPNSFNSLTPKFTKVTAAFLSQVSVGNIFSYPKHRLIINQHSS